MPYEISLNDIRAYLAALAPDQPCGTPSRPRACLVEQALEHKYPGTTFHVDGDDAHAIRLHDYSPRFGLPGDVRWVVRSFDRMAPPDNPTELSVTRQQAEDAIPELTGKGE